MWYEDAQHPLNIEDPWPKYNELVKQIDLLGVKVKAPVGTNPKECFTEVKKQSKGKGKGKSKDQPKREVADYPKVPAL